ncbi:uncharacterized protein PHACADRAFT_183375 [Phanerochaete carnosa HHB-10118-sp]|uniref:Uncharacterized protein n=1 Tax=Phanerochaete carnosa (strain HHB-10118-sp) TaxID=650164 RepID=K5V2P2_PHACS|nr:uncharacterized protein PHACADRAFT_183375 [Phanerochaete carnosa HHB-10118-sp]EKM56786.1 hypothetical protein PHACADRAFT_183375 [Phanerochaete carnosa HHB-10118-sp]
MRQEFEKSINHDKPQHPTVIHVPYDPNSIAPSQPVVVILRGKVKDHLFKLELHAKVAGTLQELKGLAFGGPTLEDPDLYYLIFGARTIEVGVSRSLDNGDADNYWQKCNLDDTDAKLMRSLGVYVDVERRHAWLKPFADIDRAKD